MNIRTTIDPISHKEVSNPEDHPCVYEGDGDNGISIYFENEDNRKTYMDLKTGGNIVVQGSDTDDYVAEG